MMSRDGAGAALSTVGGSDIALHPSNAGEALPGASQSLPEFVLAELRKGSASGRALAGQLGLRWAAVFRALRELVVSGEVRIEGRGRASRYVLAVPEAAAPRPGCQFHREERRETSCAWCHEIAVLERRAEVP